MMCCPIPKSRWLLPAGWLMAALAVAWADDPVPNPPDTPGPEAIQQQQPSFYVRAAVNRDDRTYYEEDTLAVRVMAEVDAYLYVSYKQADGKVFQIFPNSKQRENRVKGKEPVTIGQGDDEFRWQVGAPYGKEFIKVIASKEPLTELSNPTLQQKRFNPVSDDQWKGVALEVEKLKPPAWSESILEITTVAGKRPPPKPATKRYGVFFGVAQYEFNAEHAAANDGKGLNLHGCANDARQMGKMLKDSGGLADVKVYVEKS